MDGYIKRTIGEERIKIICDEHKLDTEDRKILNTILEEWKRPSDSNSREMDLNLKVLKNHPNRTRIVTAVCEAIINFSYIQFKRRLNAENN